MWYRVARRVIVTFAWVTASCRCGDVFRSLVNDNWLLYSKKPPGNDLSSAYDRTLVILHSHTRCKCRSSSSSRMTMRRVCLIDCDRTARQKLDGTAQFWRRSSISDADIKLAAADGSLYAVADPTLRLTPCNSAIQSRFFRVTLASRRHLCIVDIR